jgi:hypothetical protein
MTAGARHMAAPGMGGRNGSRDLLFDEGGAAEVRGGGAAVAGYGSGHAA